MWGNCPHGRRVVAEVDDVSRFYVEVDGNARVAVGLDAGEAKHEAGCAISNAS